MKKTLLLTLAICIGCFVFTPKLLSNDEVVDPGTDVVAETEVEATPDSEPVIDLPPKVDMLITSSQGAFYVPEAWETNLDSMMCSWHVRTHAMKSEHPAYMEVHPVSDSIYIDRLSKLHNVIELPFNDVVRNGINLYVDRRRKSVEYMLGLEHFYFPMIEEALDKNGLPDELKYLAIVESALNPVAVSRAGATGLWQFMLQTGKQYGLEINSIVDERRDPMKATYAACEYFKDMYKIYGDWTLVIAAYNCGAGNVNKAIKRAGGKTDYWDIYPFLPKETRSYVPIFIAATYVMNYYPYHNLYPVEMSMPLNTDTVMVDKQIHFQQIADLLEVDMETLRALNPQYKRDIVPGHIYPRAIRLPAVQAYAFVEQENTIADHRIDELFPNRAHAGDYSSNNNEKINHKVKKGETLSSIASYYGVKMTDLRKWNGLKSNKVNPGKNLIVYANSMGYSTNATASAKPASSATKSTTASKSTSSSKSKSTVSSQKKKATTYGTYKVKSGDTLSSIAQRYKGYSYQDLMRINGMKTTKIRVGQVIKVPKG
jgi:Soluble lytic murein transglycosylase and related regulatory proteins (some contain LysM/invasin domains)